MKDFKAEIDKKNAQILGLKVSNENISRGEQDRFKSDKLNDPRLSVDENKLAHDLTVDLVEKYQDAILAKINFKEDFEKELLKNLGTSIWKDERISKTNDQKFQIFSNNVYSRMIDLVYDHANEDSLKLVKSLSETHRGKIARTLVTDNINSGLSHKIKRAWDLGSLEFRLKTKEQTKGKSNLNSFVEFVSKNQAEFNHNKFLLHDALEAISSYQADLKDLMESKKLSHQNYKNIVKKIDSIKKRITGLTERVNDLRGWPRFYSFWEKLPLTDTIETKQRKLWNEQNTTENEIIELEEMIRDKVNKDFVVNSSVLNQGNDLLSINQLEGRNGLLMQRIEFLANFRESLLATEKLTSDQNNFLDIKANKDNISNKKLQIRKINKFNKKWTAKEYAFLEKLFWYEFGDRIKKIEKWQAELPYVSRKGQSAYVQATTAISREYLDLERDIKLFGEKNHVFGLSNTLERQLGTVALRHILKDHAINEEAPEVIEFNKNNAHKSIRYDQINQLIGNNNQNILVLEEEAKELRKQELEEVAKKANETKRVEEQKVNEALPAISTANKLEKAEDGPTKDVKISVDNEKPDNKTAPLTESKSSSAEDKTVLGKDKTETKTISSPANGSEHKEQSKETSTNPEAIIAELRNLLNSALAENKALKERLDQKTRENDREIAELKQQVAELMKNSKKP